MKKDAIVLLSGGVDSTTTLAIAKSEGYQCRALTFDYGQRHRFELQAAARVATALGVVEHLVFRIDFRQFGGSALTAEVAVPKGRSASEMVGIPITYVPGRNTVFLSVAAAFAEARDARDIFIGVNAVDYSGYPDCRPEFLAALEAALAQGSKCGVANERIRIHAPLMTRSKADIITLGISLGVDYSLTHSCYDPTALGLACGRCDACEIRRHGFISIGVGDPTTYGEREMTAS